jgi:hypothetical protein
VALFGFLAMLYPNLLSFKLFLALNLLGLIVFGMAARFRFLDKVVVPLIVCICFIYAWQYFLPDSYRSATRYLSSWSRRISTFTDRGSLGNEVEAVATYGSFLKDITVLYRLTDNSLHDFDTLLSKETIVKVVNHKEEIMVYEGQGFVLIQLAKENGSFIGGSKYWIEAEFVRLVNPKKLVSEKASSLDSSSSSKSANSDQKGHELEDKNIVYDQSKVSYLIYDLGKTYVYNLKAGEETPWRGFQPDYLSKFGISSEKEYVDGKRIEGEYTVYFSDGTSYNSKTTTTIPSKGKIFMKIKAHEKQTIYVSVL